MKTTAAVAIVLLYLSLLAASLYGYVHNVMALIHHTGPFAVVEIIRVVGLVVLPIGVVMGYVT